ncbi:hypothetical protein MZO42_15175 [Sphingomonas psychrotolerans]|uniref:Uncharacterized protein n=1 Tax=Sphingomonas psychrotolerans TaxID=1327635 RepID=A0ABU3N6N2_9SPHN|nr:hypothetical protein [Sphingomonas psychrotolerans]MDT8760043.1 hypothetical protein [Sphingomonas psychrotolerans]
MLEMRNPAAVRAELVEALFRVVQRKVAPFGAPFGAAQDRLRQAQGERQGVR